MNNDQLTAKIESFWEWFVGMEPQYRAFFTEEIAVNHKFLKDSMDNRVLDFGRFKWEMGEGKEVKYFLTISPNGSPELFDISRQIVSLSPSLFDWEFFSAKPPKIWDYTFDIYDDFMRLTPVDATVWKFSMVKNRQGFLDLIVAAPNIQNLDPDTIKAAGETVIINILGEADFIKRIGSVEIVPAFEEEKLEGIFPIQNLVWEFEEMI